MLKTTSPVISVSGRRGRRRSACRPPAAGTRRSLDQSLDCLNSSLNRPRRAARTARSRRSSARRRRAPSARCRASRFSSRARGDGVAHDVDLDALRRAVRARSARRRCATRCRRRSPGRGRPAGRSRRRRWRRSRSSRPARRRREVLGDLGDRRPEPLRVLLGHDHRARRARSAPCTSLPMFAATSSKSQHDRPEPLLDVDDDERPPGRGLERAQATAPMANERSR